MNYQQTITRNICFVFAGVIGISALWFLWQLTKDLSRRKLQKNSNDHFSIAVLIEDESTKELALKVLRELLASMCILTLIGAAYSFLANTKSGESSFDI
jgi:hypothetical protein